MIDYPALAALAEIIRRGSFEGAAHALGITQPAVSQRIRGLEARMGQILLDRGPPVTATPAGQRLIAHYDQVRLLETGLEGYAAARQEPATVRIAVNADSLATWAMAALPAAPGLLDLVIDDQDHAEKWLRGGLVVAAITAGRGPVAGCDSHALGAMRYLATASPQFMRQYFPDGLTPEALGRAPALRFNSKDALQDRWAARVTGRPAALPFHLIPDTRSFAQATILGMGWGMNPEALIADDLAAGRLVCMGDEAALMVPLFWQVTRVMAPALAPFSRALRRAGAATLWPVAAAEKP
ncbi:MAG: LysR family transcriptional regulator ArgP [Paracoccus sp. (in: a-proteobacteria)]|nr:LysR family transcriptional regulator ArgP [Paracoccus sp. (in: a-proteobacteria)]